MTRQARTSFGSRLLLSCSPGLLQEANSAGRIQACLAEVRDSGYLGVAVDFSEVMEIAPEGAPRLVREFRESAANLDLEFWPGIDERKRTHAAMSAAASPWLMLWEQDAREPIPETQRAETLAFLLRRDGAVLLESVYIPVSGQRPLTWPASTVFLGRVVEAVEREARGDARGVAEGVIGIDALAALARLFAAEEGGAAGCTGVWLRATRSAHAQVPPANPEPVEASERSSAPAFWHAGQRRFYLPWMQGLAGAVLERHGVNLLERLPELLWRRANGRHQEARWAYRETLMVLSGRGEESAKSHARSPGALAGWCARHGLHLAGSFGEWGGLAAVARRDFTSRGWTEEIHEPWLIVDENLGLHAVIRAATTGRITGRVPALLLNDGPTTLAEWRWRLESLLVLGSLRWMVATARGGWIPTSAPAPAAAPARDPQQACARRHERVLNDHIAALAVALDALEERGDLLLLDPLESAWAVDSPADSVPLGILQRDLEQVIDTLVSQQRQVDLVSEEQLERLGVVESEGAARIRVGGVSAGALVLPPVARIRRRTRELIERFLALGGPVVAIRRGGGAQWSLNADAAALLADSRVCPLPADAIDEILAGVLARLYPPPLEIQTAVADPAPPVRVCWGRRSGRFCAFVVSLARDHPITLHLRVADPADRFTHIRDPRSGCSSPVVRPATALAGQVVRSGASREIPGSGETVALELPPGGSAWLESGGFEDGASPPAQMIVAPPAQRVWTLGPPQSVQPEGMSILPLFSNTANDLSAVSTPASSTALRVTHDFELSFPESSPVTSGAAASASGSIVALALLLPASLHSDWCLNGIPLRKAAPEVTTWLDQFGARAELACLGGRFDAGHVQSRWHSLDLREALRPGLNRLVGTIDRQTCALAPGEALPLLLVGSFALQSGSCAPPVLAPWPRRVTIGAAGIPGFSHFHGDLVYRWRVSGPLPAGTIRATLDLSPGQLPVAAASLALTVDDAAPLILPWPPFVADLTAALRVPGDHWLEVRALNCGGEPKSKPATSNNRGHNLRAGAVGLLTTPILRFHGPSQGS